MRVKYKDPIHKGSPLKKKLIKNPRIALVITTHISENMRFEYPLRDHDLSIRPSYLENKLDNFKFVISCLNHYSAGMDYDLVIIDNATQDEQMLEYLSELKPAIFVKRANNGFSFGGFKYAWENFSENYDYWCFIEQDSAPCKHNWLKELYGEFHRYKHIGCVGNVVEYRTVNDTDNPDAIKQQFEAIDTHRDYIYSLDGGFKFTSSEVLKQVYKKNKLRVKSGGIDNSTINEILFVQPILECGYTIVGLGDQDTTKSDRFYSYGMCKGDFIEPFNEEALVPMIDANTRHTCKQMKEYFNWYGDN